MLPVRFLRSFPLDTFTRDSFFEPLRKMEAIMGGEEPLSLRLDVRDEAQRYVIEADVPGFRKENLDVTFEGGVLTLTAERRQESESENDNYHMRERTFGKVSRSLRLPDNVNAASIQAKLRDGVLSLTLDKTEEAKPHKIEVAEG